jgi:hypothetical protein
MIDRLKFLATIINFLRNPAEPEPIFSTIHGDWALFYPAWDRLMLAMEQGLEQIHEQRIDIGTGTGQGESCLPTLGARAQQLPYDGQGVLSISTRHNHPVFVATQRQRR